MSCLTGQIQLYDINTLERFQYTFNDNDSQIYFELLVISMEKYLFCFHWPYNKGLKQCLKVRV